MPSGCSSETRLESSAFGLPSCTAAALRRTIAWIDLGEGVAILFPARSASFLIDGSFTISQRSASLKGVRYFHGIPLA